MLYSLGAMKNYSFPEHTADLIVEAEGETPEEALEALAEGLFVAMGAGPGRARPERAVTVSASGADRAETAVSLFSEVFWTVYGCGFAPSDARVISFGEMNAEMEVRGEDFDPARHELTEVKAATYHEFACRRTLKGAWRMRVLFDL